MGRYRLIEWAVSKRGLGVLEATSCIDSGRLGTSDHENARVLSRTSGGRSGLAYEVLTGRARPLV